MKWEVLLDGLCAHHSSLAILRVDCGRFQMQSGTCNNARDWWKHPNCYISELGKDCSLSHWLSCRGPAEVEASVIDGDFSYASGLSRV